MEGTNDVRVDTDEVKRDICVAIYVYFEEWGKTFCHLLHGVCNLKKDRETIRTGNSKSHLSIKILSLIKNFIRNFQVN